MKEVEQMVQWFGRTDRMLRADLQPGDALLIPSIWLHDVEYIEGGHGVNAFYDAPQGTPSLAIEPSSLSNLTVRPLTFTFRAQVIWPCASGSKIFWTK